VKGNKDTADFAEITIIDITVTKHGTAVIKAILDIIAINYITDNTVSTIIWTMLTPYSYCPGK
jgi:hypothetical protein